MKFNEIKWISISAWERSKSQALSIDGAELYLVRRNDEIGTELEYYFYCPETKTHLYEGLTRFEILGLVAKAKPLNEV